VPALRDPKSEPDVEFLPRLNRRRIGDKGARGDLLPSVALRESRKVEGDENREDGGEQFFHACGMAV
jgi:hypothetical protein